MSLIRPRAVVASLVIAAMATLPMLPSVAYAGGTTRTAPLGEDEIRLKDGTTMRGTVVVEKEGEKVVFVQGGTGDTLELPWDDVDVIERNKYRPRPESSSEPAPTPEPEEPAEDAEELRRLEKKEGPLVQIRYTREPKGGATLARLEGEFTGQIPGYNIYGIEYRAVCTGKCNKEIEQPGAQYFIMGEKLRASKRFTLAGHGDPVKLTVRPGTRGMYWGGWAMAAAGLTLVSVGLVVYIGADTAELSDSAFEENNRSAKTERAAGIGMMVGGGLVTGGSIPLFVFSRSKVKFGWKDEQK